MIGNLFKLLQWIAVGVVIFVVVSNPRLREWVLDLGQPELGDAEVRKMAAQVREKPRCLHYRDQLHRESRKRDDERGYRVKLAWQAANADGCVKPYFNPGIDRVKDLQ